jgi:ABC-type dipeptide/oligopeptide/nickel transport system ATPase component
MPLLDLRNLQIDFGTAPNAVRAVDDVSLTLETGKTLALVGESGCGKSVTALSIARLVPNSAGALCAGRNPAQWP